MLLFIPRRLWTSTGNMYYTVKFTTPASDWKLDYLVAIICVLFCFHNIWPVLLLTVAMNFGPLYPTNKKLYIDIQ